MTTVNELAKALSAFQGEALPASIDSTNPHFKSRYASLTSIWETIRPLLTKHGLAVSQFPESATDGVALRTILMHSSGQCIEYAFSMPVSKRDPQGIGSAITYARRYALCAVLGIVADEDDDGNQASTPNAPTQGRTMAKPVATVRPAPAKAEARPPVGASDLTPAIKSLMRQWATATGSNATDKPAFVAFAKLQLHEDEQGVDLADSKNWDTDLLAIVGEAIKEMKVA